MLRLFYILSFLVLFSCKMQTSELADQSFGGAWSAGGGDNANRVEAADTTAGFTNKLLIASAVADGLGDTLLSHPDNLAAYTTKHFAKDL